MTTENSNYGVQIGESARVNAGAIAGRTRRKRDDWRRERHLWPF